MSACGAASPQWPWTGWSRTSITSATSGSGSGWRPRNVTRDPTLEVPQHRAAPSHRFPAIEALRGLAALMVVAEHSRGSAISNPTAVHYLIELRSGVEGFFVISGFVLFLPHVTDADRFRAPTFARRRLARILPGYLVMLAGAAIILPSAITWVHASVPRYLLFLQAFTARSSAEALHAGIGPTWSA